MRTDIDRTLKILLVIILTAVVGYFGWQVVQRVLYPLEMLVMGAIVAFILSPLVDRLHEYGFPRPLAILAVYIGLVGVLTLLGYYLISPLLEQITNLTKDLPGRADDFQKYLNKLHLDKTLHRYNLPTTDNLKGQAVDYAKGLSSQLIANLSALLYASFNFIVNTVLVLVIAFYLLLDGERLKDSVYALIPASLVERVTFVEVTINTVLGGYLRGQLLMSLTIGTMAGVGTGAMNVKYPLVVGVLAGILELVPMLGPWLASMPAVALALFSDHPWPLVLWVAIYFLIIQQLESNVIGPRITGQAVGLHPLGALMALLVGIELDGILGALFAVPVAGMLYVFLMAIYYNLSGRARPERREKPAGSSFLGTLSGRVAWRRPALRRRIAVLGAEAHERPGRLVAMQRETEQLRDKRQRRQAAQERAAHVAQDAGEPLAQPDPGQAAPPDAYPDGSPGHAGVPAAERVAEEPAAVR